VTDGGSDMRSSSIRVTGATDVPSWRSPQSLTEITTSRGAPASVRAGARLSWRELGSGLRNVQQLRPAGCFFTLCRWGVLIWQNVRPGRTLFT
jgi:hypothetical protein